MSGTQEADLHLLGRAAHIGKVMARYGLGERGAADVPLTERAKSLRAALEELGPTFAKLGQILSTRPDLLPPEFIAELSTLQDQVPPMTEEEVVAVMEEELRVPWEDVFESIDPEPLAAGTIGQVHAATLEGGDRVVVKVQRRGAEEEIMRDLGLLELFAEKAEHREGLRRLVDFPSVIRHLSESLRRELDFRMEAANVDRLAEVLERYSRLDVPSVYHELSSKRLLVLSFVDGVPVRDTPDVPERKDAARQLIESYYRQVLVDGFFHADPHPGNLLWSDGTVVFLDCGMVGEVGTQMRELVLMLVMAFWREDDEFLAEVVLQLADQELPEDFDMEAFQHEIAELVQSVRGQSLQEIQLGPILQGITQIAARRDVRLPAELALTAKALAQMQLAASVLDPELDPFSVVGRFLARRLFERGREAVDPKKAFYEVQKVKVRLSGLVEAIERLVGARPGQRFQVDLKGTGGLEDTIRRAARRVALAVVAGSAIVAGGFTAGSPDVGAWLPLLFTAVGAGMLVLLLLDLFVKRK
ncbi:MAG TPA: AarF/UbiB family protein [Gaiellaceae bacterium]|nr:AarF/UbiB family protein [Gaiellaceae bacterium]